MARKTSKFVSTSRAICHFLNYYWFLIFWTGLWIGLFCKTFWRYHTAEEFRNLRQILGVSLPLGRGSAAPLAVSCAVAPLAVCRALHPVLARLHPALLHAALRRAKQVHYAAAAGIVIGAVIHSMSHVANAIRFSENYDPRYGELNWARFKGENPLFLMLRSWAGATGVLMLLALLVVSCTSLRRVRRTRHAVFWFAHQVAAPLILFLLLLHPLSGVLKQQINLKTHLKENLRILNNDSSIESEVQYVPIKSMAWIWPAMGLLLCTIDTIWRYFGTYDPVHTVNATCLAGGAIELTLAATRGPEFSPKPGQYVVLRCPRISWIEYHPFTIARCPSPCDKSFSLIISQQGDWTRALYQEVEICNKWLKQPCDGDKLSFSVVGPFSSPLEQLTRSKVAVYIAAGAGITPFAALIHDLLLNPGSCKPFRIHLIWIVRQKCQIIWIAQKLNELHEKFWCCNEPDRFHIRLHIIREDTETDILSVKYNEYPVLDKRCYKGKPCWEEVFTDLLALYGRNHVVVFSCGPKLLNHTIKRYCKIFNKYGANLNFVQETF